MMSIRLRAAAFGLALVTSALPPVAPAFAKGGGGGGGTTPPPATDVLPTEPPAPGVLLRESFGAADRSRPAGGKGVGRSTYTHTNINGFWVEYLGSKDTRWLAPDTGQTWRFCGASDNPNEMPSPLQATYGNGCVASEWFDPPTSHPTALVPFRAPDAPYEVSMDGYPAPIPGGYVAIGLTNSGLLVSNLETSASVWLVVRPLDTAGFWTLTFELRANGLTGELLAAGDAGYPGFNPMALAYDPIAHTVSATLNGQYFGPFDLTIPSPKYVGFEGIGILDNFVVRLSD